MDRHRTCMRTSIAAHHHSAPMWTAKASQTKPRGFMSCGLYRRHTNIQASGSSHMICVLSRSSVDSTQAPVLVDRRPLPLSIANCEVRPACDVLTETNCVLQVSGSARASRPIKQTETREAVNPEPQDEKEKLVNSYTSPKTCSVPA